MVFNTVDLPAPVGPTTIVVWRVCIVSKSWTTLSTCLKNFNTSITLYDLLRKVGCKIIFNAGTCWEYGDLTGQVSESDVPGNMQFFASIKTSLRISGQSIFAYEGINFIWGRFFFVYDLFCLMIIRTMFRNFWINNLTKTIFPGPKFVVFRGDSF